MLRNYSPFRNTNSIHSKRSVHVSASNRSDTLYLTTLPLLTIIFYVQKTRLFMCVSDRDLLFAVPIFLSFQYILT
jgi:hypothetical protein